MRAGEARVAKESGAAGEDLFIGSLHVRVSTDQSADSPIKHPRHGNLLGCRLSMEIDKDDSGALTQFFDFCQHGVEGVFERCHERAALQIDDTNRGKAITLKNKAALTGSVARIIQRPHKTLFTG